MNIDLHWYFRRDDTWSVRCARTGREQWYFHTGEPDFQSAMEIAAPAIALWNYSDHVRLRSPDPEFG
jgi:hypothetical protein